MPDSSLVHELAPSWMLPVGLALALGWFAGFLPPVLHVQLQTLVFVLGSTCRGPVTLQSLLHVLT